MLASTGRRAPSRDTFEPFVACGHTTPVGVVYLKAGLFGRLKSHAEPCRSPSEASRFEIVMQGLTSPMDAG